MKTLLITAFTGITSSLGLLAGSINVVHVGPADVLKFEVSAGEASLDFTLAHGANTGSFVLPDKPATIKGFTEDVPTLDLPASENPRVAVLAPSEKGFKWHVIEGKPTDEKWAFRIINLSTEPASVMSGKEPLEIPAGGETAVAVTGKSQIHIKITDAVDLSYKGNEPSGVIAFVYRKGEDWEAVFIPDR